MEPAILMFYCYTHRVVFFLERCPHFWGHQSGVPVLQRTCIITVEPLTMEHSESGQPPYNVQRLPIYCPQFLPLKKGQHLKTLGPNVSIIQRFHCSRSSRATYHAKQSPFQYTNTLQLVLNSINRGVLYIISGTSHLRFYLNRASV